MEQFDINSILLSNKYEDIKEDLKERIVEDLAQGTLKFSNDVVPAKNSFLKDKPVEVVLNGSAYEMSYGNFITLLILARPYNIFQVKMQEETLFDLSNLEEYQDYYTELLETFHYNNRIKGIIKDIIGELAIFSGDINVTFGNTVSIKSLIDLGKNVTEFRDLLHYKLPKDEAIEFNEIENIIKENLANVMNILSNTDNLLKNFTNSGAGINPKQMGQVITLIGSKPDLFGNIIPHPINTSFLRGLSVRDYYINALGARKALITNHQQVRNSGYLTRKISMLLMDTKLAEIEDCGSHANNYLDINIDSMDTLKRYSKRYYLNEMTNELEVIDVTDKDFIGQIIKIPSPTTCACNDGICKKCYGELFDINKDLNIGMIAVLILTDPLTQRLLSAKHLLETRSAKIEWGEQFEKFFVVNRNLVIPKSTTDTIIIKEEDYLEDDETEDGQVFTNFTIKSGSKYHPVSSYLKLYLTESFSKKIDDFYNVEDTQYEIPLNQLDDGDSFAFFVMENNELSRPLREIKDLIETNKYIKEHTINESVNYFVYLLNESGIGIQSVHIELILREMMKLMINSDREQFKADAMPSYDLLRITDAILKGDSLSRALLFEQIKKQLTTLDYGTFDKTQESILDKLL